MKFKPPYPLEEAYQHLRNKLNIYGKMYNLSDADCQDLLHDSYIKLSSTKIESKLEARGKLWVTLKNLAIDRLRSSKVLEYRESIEADSQILSEEDDFLKNDNCRHIIDEMRSILTPLQLQIMILLGVEGFDYPDIARKLDMNEGAVRTNVSRARKILKEKLKI